MTLSSVKGFTLIEVLLVVVIISMTAGLTVPVGVQYLQSSDLANATGQYVQNLRQAQQYAFNANGDDSWGVRIDNGSIILFKGSDFSTRDTSFDQFTAISNSVQTSGDSEIIFQRGSGRIGSATSTIISDGGSSSRNVEVSAIGVVSQ